MTLSNRNYYRAQTRAKYAPRARGQFIAAAPRPLPQPTLEPWQARFREALKARPAEFSCQWLTFVDLVWPEDRFIPYQESALKTEKAIELWNAGERDLPTLAAAVNAAYAA